MPNCVLKEYRGVLRLFDILPSCSFQKIFAFPYHICTYERVKVKEIVFSRQNYFLCTKICHKSFLLKFLLRFSAGSEIVTRLSSLHPSKGSSKDRYCFWSKNSREKYKQFLAVFVCILVLFIT